jgi:hypothetical protein
MAVIKMFDRNIAKQIGDESRAALAAIAKKYGVAITSVGGKYGDDNFKMAVQWRLADPAAVQDADKANFDRYCNLFDMTPAHFGAKFVVRGVDYRVCGLAMNRRKFPIKGKAVVGGKVMLFTESVVKQLSSDKSNQRWMEKAAIEDAMKAASEKMPKNKTKDQPAKKLARKLVGAKPRQTPAQLYAKAGKVLGKAKKPVGKASKPAVKKRAANVDSDWF